MRIEDAVGSDAAACAAIYVPYVRDTVITFELDPPDDDEMSRRITDAQRGHAWLVARSGGSDAAGSDEGVVGYAYGHRFAERAAYRWTCEVSVYLEPGRGGNGLGRALYTELFARLGARGYRMAFAGMTLPNPASEGLHRAMGFERAGVLRSVGWKHGAWHDVAWCQRALGPAGEPPAELS